MAENKWVTGGYNLDLPPTQDSSGKWRFSLGFPTKNVIILVVTVTGWGVDLSYNPTYGVYIIPLIITGI